MGAALLGVGFWQAVAWWRRRRPQRLVVEGMSMAPTLLPGDRLVVLGGLPPAPGDLVALDDPLRPARLLVKRVRAIGPAGLDVRGDNPSASTDSRAFGPVPVAGVRGRVVYRYGPAGRAGRL